jgi:type I site-specific restriction endonuclease
MNVDYDMMIANAKAERDKAADDLKHYRLYTAKQQNGHLRKQTIRKLTNYKRMLDARIRRLQEQTKTPNT